MKRLIFVCIAITLFLAALGGCSNGSEESPSTTEPLIAKSISTIPSTMPLDDVSIIFPEKFSIWSEEDSKQNRGYLGQYRAVYYGANMASSSFGSITREARREWGSNHPYQKTDPIEPIPLSFIKYFDVSFEEFDHVTKKTYLLYLELETDMTHEDNEIPNAQLLYTFNLKRIKDYYSLDPARNESARKWLEEWLKTNEPYESYSAYLKANPQ